MNYVPLGERDRLAQEYLDPRKGKETVTGLTKTFIEWDLLCPEFSTSE